MTEIFEAPDSSAARLRVTGILSGVSSTQTYEAFTNAALITKWWSETATIDARVGGGIELGWPEMEWTLRGRFLELTPERALSFTWKWDHAPELAERLVTVQLTQDDDDTRIVLDHGDYGPGDEDERSGHLAGWQHFLPRIPGALLG